MFGRDGCRERYFLEGGSLVSASMIGEFISTFSLLTFFFLLAASKKGLDPILLFTLGNKVCQGDRKYLAGAGISPDFFCFAVYRQKKHEKYRASLSIRCAGVDIVVK